MINTFWLLIPNTGFIQRSPPIRNRIATTEVKENNRAEFPLKLGWNSARWFVSSGLWQLVMVLNTLLVIYLYIHIPGEVLLIFYPRMETRFIINKMSLSHEIRVHGRTFWNFHCEAKRTYRGNDVISLTRYIRTNCSRALTQSTFSLCRLVHRFLVISKHFM